MLRHVMYRAYGNGYHSIVPVRNPAHKSYLPYRHLLYVVIPHLTSTTPAPDALHQSLPHPPPLPPHPCRPTQPSTQQKPSTRVAAPTRAAAPTHPLTHSLTQVRQGDGQVVAHDGEVGRRRQGRLIRRHRLRQPPTLPQQHAQVAVRLQLAVRQLAVRQSVVSVVSACVR